MPFVLPVPQFMLVPAHPGDMVATPVRLAPNLSLRYGTVLAEYDGSPGTYGPYTSSAADGLAGAKGLLRYSCASDGDGNVTVASLSPARGPLADRPVGRVDAYFHGSFRTEDLVGLDQAAVAALGRLLSGTVTSGILRLK